MPSKSKQISYSSSVAFHIIVFVILMFFNLSFDYTPSDYVELSFGVSTEEGSSGAIGNQIEKVEEVAKPEIESKTELNSKEVKEVELPIAKNTEDESEIVPAASEKEVAEVSSEETTNPDNSNITTTGQGNEAVGDGSFGFDIDWGGKGTRKIYSFLLPNYPEGVKKEVNIKLQFTILPDGTVGTITPKIKADARLESVAINSLRQWRFEALSPNQKQVEQTAIIVFPYRLQ
jgi:outer membrane biosynthesis protein TonB